MRRLGELTSARREITGKVLGARPAMAKLGAAAVLGAMAAGTSASTLVRALDRVLPRTASALTATALLGGAAAALAAAAREELRRIGSLVPEQTVQSVKADVAAVADAASSS
jgi:Putative Actinobacterial Holin-X, holin superfamily III